MRFNVHDADAKKDRGQVVDLLHKQLARYDRVIDLLVQTNALLAQLIHQEEQVMADLSALQAEVAQNGDAVASAVALLGGLSQQLKDALAANDPAAIQALVDELDANTATLADAVTANTPADPNAPQVNPLEGETPA